MKKLARVLILVLAFVLFPPNSSAQFNAAGDLGSMHLPFEVTTPDGLVLPAGDYQVNVHRPLLQPVGRPPASLGRWPGPRIRLSQFQAALGKSVTFSLKTAVEVLVVYDLPREWERMQQVRSASPGVAPFIRNRRDLVAIIYQGDTLYITEASREGFRR